MDTKLVSTTRRWLHHMGIPIAKNLLQQKLLSHPAYPSLLCITDTLDELNIDNAAIVVDKKQLEALPLPFLARVNERESDFMLITNIEQLTSDKNFIQNWDGVAIVAEAPDQFNNTDNDIALQKEKRDRLATGLMITLSAFLFIYGLGASFSIFNFIWILGGAAGLLLSLLLIQQEWGISNSITDQFCAAGKKIDCNAVLQSTNPAQWVTVPDIVLSWFLTQSIVFPIAWISGISNEIFSLYAIFNLAIPLISFISIYYQGWKLKKWCTLCLVTLAILWLQLGLLADQTIFFHFSPIGITAITTWISIALAVSIGWIGFIKPLLRDNQDLKTQQYRLLRFKYNPYLFKTLLQQKKRISTNSWQHDIRFGNTDSPIQVIVACNPYCAPCARTHEILDELITRRDIQVIVRFGIRVVNDEKTKAAEYLLKLLRHKPADYQRTALHTWFRHMNMDQFMKEYPLTVTPDVSSLLIQHERWSEEVQIEFTPSIFINGYPLPNPYKPSDLPVLISGLTQGAEQITEQIDEAQMIPL